MEGEIILNLTVLISLEFFFDWLLENTWVTTLFNCELLMTQLSLKLDRFIRVSIENIDSDTKMILEINRGLYEGNILISPNSRYKLTQ